MLTILIVDDDKRERNGIESLIKYHGYELKVYKATNGEEAIEMIKSNHFDILLTDIKMPFMNGIDLIKSAQRVDSNIISIIYSAYGEFEYAQEAVSLGVLKYLLKPVNQQEFDNLFKEVIEICKLNQKKYIEKIAKEQNMITLNLQHDIMKLLERQGDSSHLIKKILKMQPLFKSEITPLLISSQDQKFYDYWDTVKTDFKSFFAVEPLIIALDENQILALIFNEGSIEEFDKINDWLLEIANNNFAINIVMIYGEKVYPLSKLKNEVKLMQDLLDYQFFHLESLILSRDKEISLDNEYSLVNLYMDNIINSILVNNYEDAKKELDKVLHYIETQQDMDPLSIKYIFTELLKNIYEAAHSHFDITNIIKSIYSSKNIAEIKNKVLYFFQKIEKQPRISTNKNVIIDKAITIIHTDLSNCDLSLSWVADRLGISSAYFSTLFKTEINQNFTKYVTNLRLEKSKQLLIHSKLKISEISKKVGYQNQSYFISLFKTKENISPAQYRERELGNANVKNENNKMV